MDASGHFAYGAAAPTPLGDETAACRLYALKGVVEHLMTALGIQAHFIPTAGQDHRLHPMRSAYVHDADDQRLGVMGELHPELQKQYGVPPACPHSGASV